MSINIYTKQPNKGTYPEIFDSYTRCSVLSQSFYIALGYGILTNLCRIQSILHKVSTYSALYELFNRSLEIMTSRNCQNSADSIKNLIKNLKTLPLMSYLLSVTEKGVDLMIFTRFIFLVILQDTYPEEAALAEGMVEGPKDYLNVLQEASKNLKICIYLEEETGQTVINQGISSKVIVFLAHSHGDFVCLNEAKYGIEQDLTVYPYIQDYSKEETFNFALENLIKSLIEILQKRNWKFSNQQKSEIKEKLDFLKKFPELKELKILNKMLEGQFCEHQFIDFARLSCGELHCIVCLKEEIELKKLLNFQVFCTCKILVPKKELDYFCKEIIDRNWREVLIEIKQNRRSNEAWDYEKYDIFEEQKSEKLNGEIIDRFLQSDASEKLRPGDLDRVFLNEEQNLIAENSSKFDSAQRDIFCYLCGTPINENSVKVYEKKPYHISCID